MSRRPGPRKSVSLHEDDLLFIVVWFFESLFYLIGGENIVTVIGMYVLIGVCLFNAFLCARQWKRYGRYS
ncbi:hypothetical protein HCTV5_152 [Halovirus HCTV-5]|uniref:hypothetical protein n=1 Tax=Halovirus HCTV-5 TaxID=1273748 RepID=UPI0003348B48|nr:hypothetical protein M200_gp078 [Halovirus HCTV-5]AGM11756.1 hypothetical protein HCTV5_152 [Halovirus HCTV-5]